MQARWDQLIILEKVSLRIMEVLEPSYSLLKAWPSHILVLRACGTTELSTCTGFSQWGLAG